MHYQLALLLYRVSLLLLLPVVLLLLVIRSFNHPAYRQRLLERLGVVSNALKPHGIIIHAASVGEVIALKAYIEQLLASEPERIITITTFTPTGSEQVSKLFAGRVQHCYLPLDIWPCTWLFLSSLKPTAVVLMETELWPNFIAQCHHRGIKLQLINGRLSDRSVNSYQKLYWLVAPCLQRFDQILAQSDDNLRNFINLGAPPAICQVSGNLKFDLHISEQVNAKINDLAALVDGQRNTWLVASSHPGDENIALLTFSALKKLYPELLLILVPRHPERFDSVYQLCCQHGFNTVKRSENKAIDSGNDIWLIDSLGELLAMCEFADVVTMGGSFSDIGGHNPLEPALFKKAIVVGHDMSNFRKVMIELLAQHGIMQLSTNENSTEQQIADALSQAIATLLNDSEARHLLGDNAYQVVHANQGASDYSVNALQQLLINQ